MEKRNRFFGNHHETAQLLGISEQALWKAVNERDCPVHSREPGVATLYDWREVLAWRIADVMPDDLDLTRERARLAAAQADKTEQALAETRGELLRTQAVVAEIGEYIDACRKRLSNLPGHLGQHLDPDTARRVEAIAKDIVYQAVVELRDFRPWMAEPDRGPVGAAAGPDGERVGGQGAAPTGRKRRRAGAVAH